MSTKLQSKLDTSSRSSKHTKQHDIVDHDHDMLVHSSTTTTNSVSSNTTATWRKRGEQVRASLIEHDETNGAQSFILSKSCSIHRYYQVADKVLDQFLHHPIDTHDELIEAYMVGHRLIKFLSIILPTHGEYYSRSDPMIVEARDRSLEQLSVVVKYLDQIALLIDKQEHEDYISSVLCQHQEEKSNKDCTTSHSQQREEMYYSDDHDDDNVDNNNDEKYNNYLATNDTRGSDSTERQNNTSTSSACNTIDSSDDPQNGDHQLRPLQHILSGRNMNNKTYHVKQHDTSTISDSVDVLLENPSTVARETFVNEDPTSTRSHTILRLSPRLDEHATTNKTQQSPPNQNCKNGLDNKASRSVESNVTLPKVQRHEMPLVRSHWVANRSMKPNANTNILDTSFSSMNSNDVHVTTNTSSIQQSSPGGSVRSIIQAWPPKQDPPGIDSASIGVSSHRETSVATLSQSKNVNHFRTTQNDTTSIIDQPEPETINIKFKPMTDLQKMSAELDKETPFRKMSQDSILRRKWNDTPDSNKDRSATHTNQRVRFTSSPSSSNPSSDHENSNNLSSDCGPIQSQIQNHPVDLFNGFNEMGANSRESLQPNEQHRNVVSPSHSSPPRNSISISVPKQNDVSSSKVQQSEAIAYTDRLNVSLDSLGFPKHNESNSIKESLPEYEQIRDSSDDPSSPSSEATSGTKSISSKVDQSDSSRNSSLSNQIVLDTSHEVSPVKLVTPTKFSSNSSRSGKPPIPVHQSIQNVARDSFRNSRRSGPVDLDVSATSDFSATSQNQSADGLSTNSRGFITDGIDYVLPLPNSANRKSHRGISNYAPSAPDWSIDYEIEKMNSRLHRENSTISIDSTEFSRNFNKQPTTNNSDENMMASPSTLNKKKNPNSPILDISTDWSPIWSNHHESDSVSRSDVSTSRRLNKSETSIASGAVPAFAGPDLSDTPWEDAWTTPVKYQQSHSPDIRKDLIPPKNQVKRGQSCTDRTTSTGSTSSSRSRDVSRDLLSSHNTSELLDPFSSRTPIESPFLRHEQESPYMIDSAAEQRLRVSMTSPMKSSRQLPTLAPNNVGLYGSLRGFQSLDCISPSYERNTIDQTNDSGRVSMMLCRSNQKRLSDQRTPNDEDWEDSSLLMLNSQQSVQPFKSCVRCLLN